MSVNFSLDCFVPKNRKARLKAMFPPKTAFSGDNPVTEKVITINF